MELPRIQLADSYKIKLNWGGRQINRPVVFQNLLTCNKCRTSLGSQPTPDAEAVGFSVLVPQLCTYR